MPGEELGLGDLDDYDDDEVLGIPPTFQNRIREALHPLLMNTGEELSEAEQLEACSKVLLAQALKHREEKGAQKK